MNTYQGVYSDLICELLEFINTHSDQFEEVTSHLVDWEFLTEYVTYDYWWPTVSTANTLNEKIQNKQIQEYIDTLLSLWEVE